MNIRRVVLGGLTALVLCGCSQEDATENAADAPGEIEVAVIEEEELEEEVEPEVDPDDQGLRIDLPQAVFKGVRKEGLRKPHFKSSYREVMAKLDPDGEVMFYWSFERSIEKLRKDSTNLVDRLGKIMSELDAEDQRQTVENGLHLIGDFVNGCGALDITAVGASTISLDERLYRNCLYLHRYPDKSKGQIWKVLGEEPREFDELSFLPEFTMAAMFFDLDLGVSKAWMERTLLESKIIKQDLVLHQMLKDYQAKVGKVNKVARLMERQWGAAVIRKSADYENFPANIGWALFARAKNKEVVDLVISMLESETGTRIYEGKKIHRVVLEEKKKVTEDKALDSFCFFQYDGHVICVDSLETAKLLIDVKEKRETGIAGDKYYQALSAGLPKKGNMFQYVSPHVSQDFIDYLKKEQNNLTEKTKQQTGKESEELSKLLSELLIDFEPVGFCCVMQNRKDGLLFTANAHEKVTQLAGVEMLAGLVATGGIIYTGFDRGKWLYNMADTKVDMQAIHKGLHAYAVKNGDKLPPDGFGGLSVLVKKKHMDKESRKPDRFISAHDDIYKAAKKKFRERNTSYAFIGGGLRVNRAEHMGMPILMTRPGVFKKGVIVMYLNGDIDVIDAKLSGPEDVIKQIADRRKYDAKQTSFLKKKITSWKLPDTLEDLDDDDDDADAGDEF